MTDTSTATVPAPQPKWFAKSKTIWGMIAMVLPMLLPLIGVDLGADGINLLNGIGEQLIQAVGAGLVLYARVKDGSPITATP